MVLADDHNPRIADYDHLCNGLSAHGFQEARLMVNLKSLPAFRARDVDQQCDAIIMEIIPATVTGDTRPPCVRPDRPEGASESHLIAPRLVLRIDDRCLGVFSLPTGVTLRDNIAMMTNLREPFYEDEIFRIGKALCESVAYARASGCTPLIHADLLTIAIDGSVRVLVLGPGSRLAHDASGVLSMPEKGIGTLLKDMAQGINHQESRRICASPRLNRLLHMVVDGDGNPSFAKDLTGSLMRDALDRHPWWNLVRAAMSVGLLIAAIIFLQLHRPILPSGTADTTDELRLAADDAKALANASAKEWVILASSERLTAPVQALDAEHMLKAGDAHHAGNELDQARMAYNKAHVLYTAAITVGKEFAALRSQAENSRGLARLSGSRWTPLIGSLYVRLPDSIERAIDAAFEGDFQYIQQNYQEAIIAYELAKQLYDVVSPDKFDELKNRHLARTCRDQASVSAGTWERLEVSMGTTVSETGNQAKQQIAAAEGLLQAGQDAAAAQAFAEAERLFDTATKIAVADMVAQVATANARELAIDAAQRWRSVAQALGNETTPEDVAAAERLIEQAHDSASQGKQEQARHNYEYAAMLYQQQIEQANTQAKTRAQAYEHQAGVMMDSLQESRKALEEKWESVRRRFQEVQTLLAEPTDPNQHEQLLAESKTVRQQYRHVARLRSYCDMNVYGGSVYEKTQAILVQGHEKMTNADYVAASLILETAAAELTKQNDFLAGLENYLNQEEEITGVKDRTLASLGPVAKELPEIKRLLDLAGENAANARNLLEDRDIVEATQSLTDAKLAYDSILPQAEVELLNHARIADSEMRTEVAIAALKELVEINPGHVAALEFIRELQSAARPSDRVTLIQGTLRVNGKKVPASPTKEELLAIFGEPSRQGTGLSVLLYDELGILATPDPETGKILNLVIYYAKPRYPSEPRNFYPGIVELEGFPIGRDASIETINTGVKTVRFQSTQISTAYQATYMGLRLLISYHPQTNQIYTISVMFLSEAQR